MSKQRQKDKIDKKEPINQVYECILLDGENGTEHKDKKVRAKPFLG